MFPMSSSKGDMFRLSCRALKNLYRQMHVCDFYKNLVNEDVDIIIKVVI